MVDLSLALNNHLERISRFFVSFQPPSPPLCLIYPTRAHLLPAQVPVHIPQRICRLFYVFPDFFLSAFLYASTAMNLWQREIRCSVQNKCVTYIDSNRVRGRQQEKREKESPWMRERERTRWAEEGKKTEMLNTKKKKKQKTKQNKKKNKRRKSRLDVTKISVRNL